LISEAIVGVLLRPLATGERITPEVFARNSGFVQFMHDAIARFAPEQADCRSEAKRQGGGWIYIIDGRTKTLPAVRARRDKSRSNLTTV
jgi:hypothetical protein